MLAGGQIKDSNLRDAVHPGLSLPLVRVESVQHLAGSGSYTADLIGNHASVY